MKFLTTLIFSIGLLTASQAAMERPSFHTKGTPTGKPTGPLKPGDYWWHPEISPQGPLMILISIPEQEMHVYRNGIMIGRSSVSSGSKGHDTPGGVFVFWRSSKAITQRHTMMHRCLTCSDLPGQASPCTPASFRAMPPATVVFVFPMISLSCSSPQPIAEATVIIGDSKTPVPRLASNPGLILAPTDFTPGMLHRWARTITTGARREVRKGQSRLSLVQPTGNVYLSQR